MFWFYHGNLVCNLRAGVCRKLVGSRTVRRRCRHHKGDARRHCRQDAALAEYLPLNTNGLRPPSLRQPPDLVQLQVLAAITRQRLCTNSRVHNASPDLQDCVQNVTQFELASRSSSAAGTSTSTQWRSRPKCPRNSEHDPFSFAGSSDRMRRGSNIL